MLVIYPKDICAGAAREQGKISGCGLQRAVSDMFYIVPVHAGNCFRILVKKNQRG